MTHKITYADGGRRLNVAIDDDADGPELERIVSEIYQWHRARHTGALSTVDSRLGFDAWVWERSAAGMTSPQIARQINATLTELVVEHVRRRRMLDAVIGGLGPGDHSLDAFMLTVKSGIDAGEAAKEAVRLLAIIRLQLDADKEIVDAVKKHDAGKRPFLPDHPVTAGLIAKALTRHRRRLNC